MPFSKTACQPGATIALALSYDGSAFKGWQAQLKPRVATVQEALEKAVSSVAGQSVKVNCAGRTDSGVHASHQVVSFISPVARSEKAWVMGCNTRLPDSVSVRWAKPVADDFHARFSATARRYRYIISNQPARPAILSQGLTHQPFPLDVASMNEAAQCLLGEQDFTSFRAVACQSNTPMRNVHFVKVVRYGQWVVVDIQANAFLYHMVRNIVGSLMDVGTGKRSVAWFHELMSIKDRSQASPTASPKGLYLVDVSYPEHFGLPSTQVGPDFLPA